MGKIFSNHVTVKGLISKYIKNPYNSKAKRKQKTKDNPIKKWAEDLNRHFPKKTYRWPTDTWKDVQHH